MLKLEQFNLCSPCSEFNRAVLLSYISPTEHTCFPSISIYEHKDSADKRAQDSTDVRQMFVNNINNIKQLI